MGFNRVVDRHIDAANPRTKDREIPAGAISASGAWTLVGVSSALFVAVAFWLNPLCGMLSPLVLAVLLGYSYAKRFTSMVHLWLGVSLGLAPLGAWLAVRGDFQGDILQPLLLAGAVLTWVAGFDLIYSCQDAEFDKGRGLHSIPPARLDRFAPCHRGGPRRAGPSGRPGLDLPGGYCHRGRSVGLGALHRDTR